MDKNKSLSKDVWSAKALNTAPNSENQIHGDDMAKEFGFKGGLVPGVTVSAYLLHPIIEKWGLDWLEKGWAKCKITSPLYDKENFSVYLNEISENKILSNLKNSNQVVTANAEASLLEDIPEAPKIRNDKIAIENFQGPRASKNVWMKLKKDGCMAFEYFWGGKDPLIYLRDQNNLPDLLNPSKKGLSNLSFLLGCSNWALASSAYMNPWIHLQTTSQNYQALSFNSSVIAEIQVNEVFEKKGHEFVDVDVNLFKQEDKSCIMTINLLSIYKVRGSSN